MATVEEVAEWVKQHLAPARGSLAAIALEVDEQFGPGFTVETENGRTLSSALRAELRRIEVTFTIPKTPARTPKPQPDEEET